MPGVSANEINMNTPACQTSHESLGVGEKFHLTTLTLVMVTLTIHVLSLILTLVTLISDLDVWPPLLISDWKTHNFHVWPWPLTLTFKHILAKVKVNLCSKNPKGRRLNGLAVRVHMDRQTNKLTNNKHTHTGPIISHLPLTWEVINYIVADPQSRAGGMLNLIKGTSMHRDCIPYWLPKSVKKLCSHSAWLQL